MSQNLKDNTVIIDSDSTSGDHKFGFVYDLDMTSTDLNTTAKLAAVGIANSGTSTNFPSFLISADGSADLGVNAPAGYWEFDASSPDDGWKIAVASEAVSAFLWPLERETEWECVVDYYIPTLVSTNGDISVVVGATSPGGRKSTFAYSHAAQSDATQYQAKTGYNVQGSTDISDTGNVFETAGTALSSGNTFAIGFRTHNGSLQVYDDNGDVWRTNADMTDITHSFSYCYVLMSLLRTTAKVSPSIQRIRFRYLDASE